MNYLAGLLAFVLSAFIVVKAIVFILELRIPVINPVERVQEVVEKFNSPPGVGDA